MGTFGEILLYLTFVNNRVIGNGIGSVVTLQRHYERGMSGPESGYGGFPLAVRTIYENNAILTKL